MLRRVLGDAGFFSLLQSWYQTRNDGEWCIIFADGTPDGETRTEYNRVRAVGGGP